MLVNFTPIPVILTIPITIPAQAQAMATGIVVLTALTKDSFISSIGKRFSLTMHFMQPTTSSTAIANIAE